METLKERFDQDRESICRELLSGNDPGEVVSADITGDWYLLWSTQYFAARIRLNRSAKNDFQKEQLLWL